MTDRRPQPGKRSIHLPNVGHKAPIPSGARVGNLLCSSAITGKSSADGALPADGAAQCANAFANLDALLAAGGATLTDVVKLAVTVNDDALRDAVNAQWLARFPDADDRPARHTTVQALQHGMAVQLEVIAVVR